MINGVRSGTRAESASSDAPNHPPLVEHLEDEGEFDEITLGWGLVLIATSLVSGQLQNQKADKLYCRDQTNLSVAPWCRGGDPSLGAIDQSLQTVSTSNLQTLCQHDGEKPGEDACPLDRASSFPP